MAYELNWEQGEENRTRELDETPEQREQRLASKVKSFEKKTEASKAKRTGQRTSSKEWNSVHSIVGTLCQVVNVSVIVDVARVISCFKCFLDLWM